MQELDGTLPVVKPDLEQLSAPPDTSIRAVWIGHATVLLQMCGVTVLTGNELRNGRK